MAEDERKRVKITSSAPGPRTVITATGGQTVRPGESITVNMSQNDLRVLKPYIDAKQLTLGEPDDADESTTSGDILKGGFAAEDANPHTSGPKVGAPDITAAGDEPDHEEPTGVEHRGFGRWYGTRDGQPVTEAMNKSEAEAYAAEHGLTLGASPDPSTDASAAAGETAPPEAAAAAPDETAGKPAE